ncbi:MAG TPA: protein kinase, partial [Ktedonobacteraceae bacterium]|nr:protein kinase [Ktedonobacteraceae bacterium]
MENTSIHTDWQGKLIGRYQLERVLGSGALSEVWLATDTRLRREVAIKLLPPATNDQSYLRDFVYEARAAASLEHPHILVIHDFGEGELDGEVVPYLVFPYIAGGTLATRMKEADGPLPIQESLRYLHHAALAIDYAHSKRILHRDIKPANMLLRDDWLLLTDFGLARVLGGSMVRSQTSAGSGTPEYMAPEQIMGQATPASDRYSLAVVAYQLFTGRPPYHGTTPVETITRQMHDPLPPPRSLNSRIPVAVENLLTMALSRNVDLRPPSCLKLVEALQQAWMTGKQTEPNPEATLLAPWSKRWQEQSGAEDGAEDSSSSGPSSWSDTQEKPASKTSVLPGVEEAEPRAQGAGGSRTLTDANQTSGPPLPADPFATNISPNLSRPSNTALPPAYQPGGLERKVGRRTILLGGVGAAAVAVAGGAVALGVMRARGVGTPQGLPVTPTPAGPLNLIPGSPVLQLTGHSGAVWTASWHPGGRYLLTAGGDGYIMLWDIATALQNSIPGSSLATPKQKWTVAGLKFENTTDAVCWSRDGKRLIVGNT